MNAISMTPMMKEYVKYIPDGYVTARTVRGEGGQTNPFFFSKHRFIYYAVHVYYGDNKHVN